LKIVAHSKSSAPVPFEQGQVWNMKESHVRIGLVGKTLVHYKLLKGDVKRGPNSLTSQAALYNYLKKHNAILAVP
jgi:hypothetical protein